MLKTNYSRYYPVSGSALNATNEAINNGAGGGSGETPGLDAVLAKDNTTDRLAIWANGDNSASAAVAPGNVEILSGQYYFRISGDAGGIGISNTADNSGAGIGPNAIQLVTPDGGVWLISAPAGVGGMSMITLPAEAGTLALTSDIPTIPEPPATGTYVLQSVDGVMSWVAP